MSKLEADIMLLEFITAGMVVPVQNPAAMGCFEPAVKCYSDVVPIAIALGLLLVDAYVPLLSPSQQPR